MSEPARTGDLLPAEAVRESTQTEFRLTLLQFMRNYRIGRVVFTLAPGGVRISLLDGAEGMDWFVTEEEFEKDGYGVMYRMASKWHFGE